MSEEFSPVCRFPRGLVRPVRVDQSGVGGPTKGQAQKGRWRSTTKGFHVPSTVSDAVPEQRILEESMRLPEGGAVTGWAACRLAGAAYFDGLERDNTTRQPVPLIVPPTSKLRALSGSVVSREPLPNDEWRLVHGIPSAIPVRALFDEVRRVQDPREAVVALDMMSAAALVSRSELREFWESRRRWRRASRIPWVINLGDERTKSPGETRMRLIWRLDAGLPRPLVNQEVFDAHGRFLGEADLFDPEAGVVGEYDGGVHRRPGRHSRDVGREDRFRRSQLEYFEVTGLDLHDRPMLVERMLTTRARAPYLQGRHGGWTTTPPPHWRFRETAEELLAHRDWLRSLHDSA